MTGQVCSSLTRIVVSRYRHDEMVEALASAFSQVRVGDPFDTEYADGTSGAERQRDRVEGYIAKGKVGRGHAGHRWRPSGHLDKGWFVEPTVFGNVDNSSTIAQEEIFGPVLSVIPADDERTCGGDRQRHHLRAQRLGLHQRRRPGPRGGSPAAFGHRGAQLVPHRLRSSPSAGSSSRGSGARAAPKACSPSSRPRRVILTDTAGSNRIAPGRRPCPPLNRQAPLGPVGKGPTPPKSEEPASPRHRVRSGEPTNKRWVRPPQIAAIVDELPSRDR
jgi:hypothetical protein